MSELSCDTVRVVGVISGNNHFSNEGQRAENFLKLFFDRCEESCFDLTRLILHSYVHRNKYMNNEKIDMNYQVSSAQISLMLDSKWGSELGEKISRACEGASWLEELTQVVFSSMDRGQSQSASSHSRNVAVLVRALRFLRDEFDLKNKWR